MRRLLIEIVSLLVVLTSCTAVNKVDEDSSSSPVDIIFTPASLELSPGGSGIDLLRQ